MVEPEPPAPAEPPAPRAAEHATARAADHPTPRAADHPTARGAESPAPDPAPAVLAIGPSLSRADLPLLCLRLRLLAWSRGERRILCDLGRLDSWDLATVDALARLALDARRLDCRIWLVAAPRDLPGMLELVGLAEVLPCAERQPS